MNRAISFMVEHKDNSPCSSAAEGHQEVGLLPEGIMRQRYREQLNF